MKQYDVAAYFNGHDHTLTHADPAHAGAQKKKVLVGFLFMFLILCGTWSSILRKFATPQLNLKTTHGIIMHSPLTHRSLSTVVLTGCHVRMPAHKCHFRGRVLWQHELAGFSDSAIAIHVTARGERCCEGLRNSSMWSCGVWFINASQQTWCYTVSFPEVFRNVTSVDLMQAMVPNTRCSAFHWLPCVQVHRTPEQVRRRCHLPGSAQRHPCSPWVFSLVHNSVEFCGSQFHALQCAQVCSWALSQDEGIGHMAYLVGPHAVLHSNFWSR